MLCPRDSVTNPALTQKKKQTSHFCGIMPDQEFHKRLLGAASDHTTVDLATAVEELNVAEEELRAQNDQLQLAYATLHMEHERYRELFEHAPVAYLVTDRHGTIRDANRAAEQLFKCRQARLRGKPLTVFTRDVCRRRLRVVLFTLGERRDTVTMRLALENRDALIRHVEATVSVVRDIRGNVTGFRWLLVDQTRQRRRLRT